MTICVEGTMPSSIIDNKEQLEQVAPLPLLVDALEGRIKKMKPATVQQQQEELTLMFSSLDSVAIGGKLTVFVLLYGDFFNMHKKCLTSLMSTTPADKIDLRLGCVQLGDQSKQFVEQLLADGKASKAYWREDNPGKYRVMRQMFYDETHPITTKWLIWLDDDTVFDVSHEWLNILAQKINAAQDTKVRMIGPLQRFRLFPAQLQTMREAAPGSTVVVDGNKHELSWYKDRWLTDAAGKTSPNGQHVPFVTGSFWAAHVDTLYECQVPDPRLEHNGGDYWIGLQVYQSGYTCERFSDTKRLVNWSATPRRGLGQTVATHIGNIKMPYKRR